VIGSHLTEEATANAAANAPANEAIHENAKIERMCKQYVADLRIKAFSQQQLREQVRELEWQNRVIMNDYVEIKKAAVQVLQDQKRTIEARILELSSEL
jgi:hypothetical protein